MQKLFLALALVYLSASFLSCEKADGVAGSNVSPESLSSSDPFLQSSSGFSSSSQMVSSSAQSTASISPITEYVDDSGIPDGSWGVEAVLPFDTEVDSVSFEITTGAGEWEYLASQLYDGEGLDGLMFSNYFFPSCSGEFEVTVFYMLNDEWASLTTSETIVVDGLDACVTTF